MKVMLLFPPNWTPSMPHLALPTLTAYLRMHGVEVIQRDLNAEVFDEILTRRYMKNAVARLRAGLWPKCHAGNRQNAAIRLVSGFCGRSMRGRDWPNEVQKAKRVIRSDAFFDGPTSLKAFRTIIQCLEIASLPYYPASLNLQSYISAYPVDSSARILAGVKDEQHNIFLDIYRRGILEDIRREKPDVVGISIPSMPQMLAGMTLGYLIKARSGPGLSCDRRRAAYHVCCVTNCRKVPALFRSV